MQVYAMSDIHGHQQEFEVALSRVDLSGDNILVLLGDYIHGPDSYGVMDKIMYLQEKYGSKKIIALSGNHEKEALRGTWPINEEQFEYGKKTYDDGRDEKYLNWMSELPLYYKVGNTIFVHAGIDEEAAADGLWEFGTSEYFFTEKFPAETGKIDGLDMKIVAGHIGTYILADNPQYHDIYFDGGNHYYIDGTVRISGEIPVLMVDTDTDKYYRVTNSGPWPILPYDEEN